jgi:hypothetical protein
MIKQATQGLYWWPTMTRDIQSFIKQYSNYKQKNGTTPTQQKNDSTKIDWRILIVEYLNHGKTENRNSIEEDNGTYFMEEKELRIKLKYGESRICIAEDQIKYLIKMVHEQNCCHLNPNDII